MAPILLFPESLLRARLAQLTGDVAQLSVYAKDLAADLATIAAYQPPPGISDYADRPNNPWPESLHDLPAPVALALANARAAIAADGIDPVMTSIWAGATDHWRPAVQRFAGDIQYYTNERIEAAQAVASSCPRAECAFVYAEEEGKSLDPALDTTASGHQVEMQMFEGLTIMAAGNTMPEPGVASHVSVSDDGLRYTFYLRPTARWSNGRSVVAEDFRYAFLRTLDRSTGSPVAETLYPIRGAKAYNAGDLQQAEEVGVRVVDAHTLEITLAYADPRFFLATATSALLPVPEETIAAFGPQWTRPEHIVTNGAFHMVEHALRDHTTLVRSDTYWDRRAVQLERVTRYHAESEATLYDWYTLGKIDYAHRIPLDRADELLRANRSDLHTHPYLARYEYILNLQKPPFDNPKVRRAFDLAIDKKKLVTHVMRGGERVARSFIPPVFESVGYTSPYSARAFDPTEAKRLLAEAGYPDGAGLPPITFLFNASDVHTAVATFVQRELKEHLGIDVQIEQMEFQTLIDRRNTGDFQAARAAIGPDHFEYTDFIDMFTSGSPTNQSRFVDAEYDRLLERMKRTLDPAQRHALAQQAERVLDERLPTIPLFFPTTTYLLRPDISGFEENATTLHHLKHVRRGSE